MVNFAMCIDKQCPSCQRCYRFRARPSASGYQTYSDYSAFDKEDGRCPFYTSIADIPSKKLIPIHEED